MICATALILASCVHQPAREKERFDEPGQAAAYYAMRRAVEGGDSPQRRYEAARAQMGRMSRHETVGDRGIGRRDGPPAATAAVAEDTIGTWKFLGPGNIGGRMRALLIDAREPSTMVAAGISGGVWKTTDAGASWRPIGDALANLDISSLAFDPQNHDVIFAGTGEGYFREDVRGTALPLRGNGIFVTRDGGASWSRLPSTVGQDFYWVNDLVVSSHDSQRIYAATRTGVWRSADAGATWTRVVTTSVKGGCLDLAYRGDTTGDYLFTSCGVFDQAAVLRTKHGESNDPWTVVLNEAGMSRTSLAIAPSNPSVVYALAASNRRGPRETTQNLHALYRSEKDGDPASWTAQTRFDDQEKLNTALLSNAYTAIEPQCNGRNEIGSWIPMGWHCNVVAVDPVNADRVWLGGVDLFRSDDRGRTWGEASYWWTYRLQPSFVHADQHVIAFHPQYDGVANQTIFFTNDGGVYRTDNANAPLGSGTLTACHPEDSKVAFTSLNNTLGVTQFYHGAVYPDGTRYLGGAQDNGTVLGYDSLGVNGWMMQWGGDGGYVAVDPSDQRTMYFESQNAEIIRFSGTNVVDVAATLRNNDTFLFITPFVIDPARPTRLWIGGTRLWRTENRGDQWTQASTVLNGQVSAIAIGIQHAGRVLAGTNHGDVVHNDDAPNATGTTAWSAAHPRDGFVSSIAFDPTNDDVVYATYAGFGGGAHVWKSIDGGVTWSPLDGSGAGALPDIPTHSLAIDPTRPSRLYLGSDLGIFVSNDGGGQWMVENTGFASVITEFVTIAPGERGPAVYAFTHGRGAWRAELVEGRRRRAVR